MAANADGLSPATLFATAVVGLVIFQVARKLFKPQSPLDAIPSVGIPSYPFGFYVGAWNYIKNGRAITAEGFRKYPGKAFKKAPDEFLSIAEATNSLLHLEHTIGQEQYYDPYQVGVIRTAMTRNIAICFPDIRDEVVAASKIYAVEWISVPALQTILPIISRVSNRFFIGLPCRDPEYIKITSQYAMDVTGDAMWLHVTPSFLRPTATRAAMKHLAPILQYRIEMDDKYGPNWPDFERPNDMISWLLDEARGHPKRRTVRTMTRTVLNVNFGALHTTTQGLLHALYTLAANLQYVQPLREEIESVLRSEGWTKAAMGKLVKLDSFLKESFRFVPGGAVSVLREVLKDFTFSDGTTVPAGTLIGIPLLSEHHDEANYPNAGVFDPFRFSRMREQEGEGTRHQMVTPTPEFLSFGLGRHACPGRFFAVNEQKLILAHIIMTYDFKLKDGVRPEDEWIAMVGSANSTAEVMFRKRT
ncbi:cytochrome P450 [Mycena galopus ATCC 62051]|nr:cytochrome P450 [Mycena galopus ATCC 62051]